MSVKKQVEKNTEDVNEVLTKVLEREAFYEAQIHLITQHRMSFWMAKYQALTSVNPEVENLLIESHTTVPIHVERSFKVHHETIKKRLKEAKAQIHYSIDLWSWPNRKSFLGICAQLSIPIMSSVKIFSLFPNIALLTLVKQWRGIFLIQSKLMRL